MNTFTQYIPSQPPSQGLSLNDLRNYTTLTTHTSTESNNDIMCEICHDLI